MLRNATQVLPTHQREGDVFLMELLVSSGRFSPMELIWINRCRLALRVLTLADMTTGDSSRFTRDVIQVLVQERPPSKWDWPNERPGCGDMTIWRQALHFISSDSYTLPFMDRLGRWTAEPHLAYRWFYSPVHRHIFFCHNTRWDQYEPISARATRSFKRTAILPLQAIEATELQYASTHWEGEHLLFDGSAACAIQSLPVPHNMAEYILGIQLIGHCSTATFPRTHL